jgi:hypothetical protein
VAVVVLILLSATVVSAPLDAAIVAIVSATGAGEYDERTPGPSVHLRRVKAAAEALSGSTVATHLALAGLPATADAAIIGFANAGLALPAAAALVKGAVEAAEDSHRRRSATVRFLVSRAVALSAIFAVAAFASLYAGLFFYTRGTAVATGIIAAWLLGNLVAALLIRPVVEGLAVLFYFNGGAASGAAGFDAVAEGAWHHAVAVPAAAAKLNKAKTADSILALAPARLIAAAYLASPADKLKWAALAAAARAALCFLDGAEDVRAGDGPPAEDSFKVNMTRSPSMGSAQPVGAVLSSEANFARYESDALDAEVAAGAPARFPFGRPDVSAPGFRPANGPPRVPAESVGGGFVVPPLGARAVAQTMRPPPPRQPAQSLVTAGAQSLTRGLNLQKM